MPLTGEAKREWQRGYMRRYRQPVKVAKEQIKQAVESSRALAGLSVLVSQEVLRDQLQKLDLPLSLTIQTVKALHEAERPYGRDAISGPDNDARARACELSLKLHERAGTIPAGVQQSGNGTHITVNVLRFDHAQDTHTLPEAIDITSLARERVLSEDGPADEKS